MWRIYTLILLDVCAYGYACVAIPIYVVFSSASTVLFADGRPGAMKEAQQ